MKQIILVLIGMFISGIGLFWWFTDNTVPNSGYQYYFQWCSDKLAVHNIDTEFANKTCDCIAAKIVDSYPDAKELSPDELKPIIFMCLLDSPQRAAYDDL